MSDLPAGVPANAKACETCGWYCTDAYCCRVNIELARDGVEPQNFWNPVPEYGPEAS